MMYPGVPRHTQHEENDDVRRDTVYSELSTGLADENKIDKNWLLLLGRPFFR